MCPYFVKNSTKAVIIFYDQDGKETGSITSEQYHHETCKREQCGAYHKGKCRYKPRD